jgi:myxalamid-type polyketide synthase MxaB
LPLIANVTGTLAGADIATADYWVRHVSEAVRFADGMATLRDQGVTAFLEIGPKPTLLGLAQMEYEGRGPAHEEADKMDASHVAHRSPRWLPSLRQNHSDWQQMLISFGALYELGVELDWAALYQDQTKRRVLLPTYPFQRQSYWVNTPKRRREDGALRPLLDRRVKLPATRETIFETAFSVENLPFLQDHRVYGAVVVPGACHLALVLSAAEVVFAEQHSQVSDIIFPQTLALADTETRLVQLLCKPAASQGAVARLNFQLLSFTAAATEEEIPTTLHAAGAIQSTPTWPATSFSLRSVQAHCTETVDVSLYLDTDPMASIYFGPAFQWVDGLWRTNSQEEGQPFHLLARLRRPAVIESLRGYVIHPGLLDGCFQVAGLAHQWATGAVELHLPFALASGHFSAITAGDSWWCHVEVAPTGAKCDLRLFDSLGQPLAFLSDFQLRAAPRSALQGSRLPYEWLTALMWRATPLPAQAETAALPDCWLMVDASDDLQQQLSALLQQTQRPVVIAPPDAPLHPVVTALAALHRTVSVVYWGSTVATPEVTEATEQLCNRLLQLTQALLTTQLTVQLWIVTQDVHVHVGDSQPVKRHLGPAALAGGALWGMGRTIAQEQPQWRTICLDLDTTLAAATRVRLLYDELFAAVQDVTQIAYSQQARYVAYLAPWPAFARTHPMRVQLQTYGAVEHLHAVPQQRRTPGAGEIEIAVTAAGLNFRDVLNALGLLQEYYATVLGVTQASAVGLGFECAGLVTAIGAGVKQWSIGDRVMGLSLGEGAFASYLILPAAQMVAIPEGISDEEAATLPLTFLTAWYGLVELAHLQPGDRVLIHAAAGGVGQAAVQIAQRLGAEVFATASPDKWEFLRRQGVTHLFHSRTLHFAEELRQRTGGQGVTVVLNSLNGDFIEQTLATLAPHGRFVEIGKLGIWSPEQMAQARPDVTYYAFDLGEALADTPPLQLQLWQALLPHFQAGTLRPLPHTTFPIQEAVAAFRYMQQAKQLGKIVLRLAPTERPLDSMASYLITGGLGGLGLQVAQQLVADGARQICLTGRHGVTTPEQQHALDRLAAAGATVTVIPADIGDPAAVQALLHRCNRLAPLRGIVHAAGVLEDGVLSTQTPQRLANVLRPKVAGAWHLHTLTADQKLDFFVCFSSVAALLGSPGQSSYAAANAFLDRLMQHRRQQGMHGLSINWGPWAEVGMAASLSTRFQQQGLTPILPDQGRLFFRYLLQQDVAQLGVLPTQRPQPNVQPQRTGLRAILAELPAHERMTHLEAYLRTEIATVLGLSSSMALNERTRLFDFGMDSLMAVELRNRVEIGLSCKVRATLFFDYPTIEVLLPYLLNDVLNFPTTAQPPADLLPSAADDALVEAIDQLSNDELVSFISQKYEEKA